MKSRSINRTVASILFPLPLPEPFDYVVPSDMSVEPGDHVLAPLGPRSVSGVVWSIQTDQTDRELKPVTQVVGGPRISKTTRDFVDWASHYLVEPQGVILRSVLRSSASLKPSPSSPSLNVLELYLNG